jgi:hypothetical protein
MAESSKPDRIPPTVEALLFKVATAKDRPAADRFLELLCKTAQKQNDVLPAFERLCRVIPNGLELAYRFVLLFDDPLPKDLARAIVPTLKDSTVLSGLRIAVTGKVLDTAPDDRRVIQPILDNLLSGLTRAAALERLIQLQSQVANCTALDSIVEGLEAECLMKCPKCPAQLPRSGLIKHLWAKHQLIYYGDGRAASARSELDLIITSSAVAEEPTALDEAYTYSQLYFPEAERRLVFQSLAVRGNPDPTQTNRLMTLAEEQHAGLCPSCLSAVPDPVPELPPSASLASGRLSAEGYLIEVSDTGTGRVAKLAIPDGPVEVLPIRGQRVPPRLTAVFVAMPLFLLAIVGVLLIPAKFAQPLFVSFWLIIICWIGYAVVRFLTKPLPDASSQAIDHAWSELIPAITLNTTSTRFLIRLCRVSIGEGNHADRSKVLSELIEDVARRADRGASYQQLLAAARVLQVLDGARLGREKINGLTEMFEPYLRGELQTSYAEAAAEVLLSGDTLNEGDTIRLGVCLVGSTFSAGLTPADLLAIGRFGPMFRQLLLDASASHLGQLYALWRSRHNQPWSEIGEALTVFELARDVPNAARKILSEFPDTLLRITVTDIIEDQLGPILVTTRGISVGGKLLSDPDGIIEQQEHDDDEWRLRFGTYRFRLNKKLPIRFPATLQAWLQLWASRYAANAENLGKRTEKLPHMVAPLAVHCPLCDEAIVLRRGLLGTPWIAISG